MSAMPKDYRKVANHLVKEHGWTLELPCKARKAGNHARLIAPGGQPIISVPGTPGSWRTYQYFLNRVRAAGVRWPPR